MAEHDPPTTGVGAAPVSEHRQLTPRATGPTAAGGRLSVLLVDDHPSFLASLQLALDRDHDVESHHRAAEALAVLEESPTRYDIVICDLAMPGLDGVTFYERMRQLGVGDRFVLMTGGPLTSRATAFVESNVCPSLAKPFRVERLLALLDDLSRRRSVV